MLFLLFIDFSKAFDSVDREEMFKIIAAYGVPGKIVNAIRVMYQDTSAVVLTPDGTTESFTVSAGVQQGDTLAAFLFVMVLDYVLRNVLNSEDGVTIVPRKSTIKSADGTQIKMVEDFKYLGSYTNTEKDTSCRIGMAWAAAHKLDKIWRSPLCRRTKIKLFKAAVESILLYGTESWAMYVRATRKLDGC